MFKLYDIKPRIIERQNTEYKTNFKTEYNSFKTENTPSTSKWDKYINNNFEKSNSYSDKSNMKRSPSSESLPAFVQQKKTKTILNQFAQKSYKEMEMKNERITIKLCNRLIDLQKPVPNTFNNKENLKPIEQEKNNDHKKSTFQQEDAAFLDYLNSRPMIKPIAQKDVKPFNNNTNLINSKNCVQINSKPMPPSVKVDINEEDDDDFIAFLKSFQEQSNQVKNNKIVKGIETAKQERNIECISNLKLGSFIQSCCLLKKSLDSNSFIF